MNQITIVKAPRRPDLLALRAACDPRAVFCSGLLYTAVTGTYQVFFFIEPFLLCCKTLFLLIGRLMTVQCIRYCYILFILFLDVDLQSRCCHVWISLKFFFLFVYYIVKKFLLFFSIQLLCVYCYLRFICPLSFVFPMVITYTIFQKHRFGSILVDSKITSCETRSPLRDYVYFLIYRQVFDTFWLKKKKLRID